MFSIGAPSTLDALPVLSLFIQSVFGITLAGPTLANIIQDEYHYI
jgi:hypothetical protein